MPSSQSYSPTPKTLLLKKLHREGIEGLGRGVILASGDPSYHDGDVVLYHKAFSMQLERGRNIYSVWSLPNAIKAIDTRDIEQRESHFCAIGAEMPGYDPLQCKDCQLGLQLLDKLLTARMAESGKPKRRQRDLPPGFLNDLHTGKISPTEARDVFGIEIEDDPLKRGEGKQFG